MSAPARSVRASGCFLRARGRRGGAGSSPTLAPGGWVETPVTSPGWPRGRRRAGGAGASAPSQSTSGRAVRLRSFPPSVPGRACAPARAPLAAEVVATKLGPPGPGSAGRAQGAGRAGAAGGGEGGAQEAEAGADQHSRTEPPETSPLTCCPSRPARPPCLPSRLPPPRRERRPSGAAARRAAPASPRVSPPQPRKWVWGFEGRPDYLLSPVSRNFQVLGASGVPGWRRLRGAAPPHRRESGDAGSQGAGAGPGGRWAAVLPRTRQRRFSGFFCRCCC